MDGQMRMPFPDQPLTSRRGLIFSSLLCFAPAAVAHSSPDLDFPELIRSVVREVESGHYATAKASKIDDLRVLAWYREKDDRPFYLDHALCWARVTTEVGLKWALVHMVRNPSVAITGQSTNWRLRRVYDLCNRWLVYFDHPPNNSDVYSHMSLFRFKSAHDGWVRYDSYVDKDTWTAVIGQAPAKPFL
jgi:hypothetical protein